MQPNKLLGQDGTAVFWKRGRQLFAMGVGEVLIADPRPLVALNDETAMTMDANINMATVRRGLPQNFFEDDMPASLAVAISALPYIGLALRSGLGVGIPCLPISFVLMTVSIRLKYRILQ